jgi:hypothetical protein
MYPGIIQWIQDGVKPGHFLTAIIENDLRGAIERADDENVIRLQAYIRFFYNCSPGRCWGSKELVAEWAKQGGLRRTNFKPTLMTIDDEDIFNGE